jgi:hypothetical protein
VEVTIHIDPMELGFGRQQPPEKREIAARSERYLVGQRVQLGVHPVYRRADLVAVHPDKGTFVIEVEGKAQRQLEQAMYSALGQLLLVMTEFDQITTYGIAVPDSPEWERQFEKIPQRVCERLRLRRLLVSAEGVSFFGLEAEPEDEREIGI